MSNFGCGALFFGAFFVILLAGTGWNIYYLRRSRSALAWPSTSGTVIDCQLSATSYHTERGWEGYYVSVKYAYRVNGREYVGERIAFGYNSSNGGNGRWNYQLYEKIKNAGNIPVYYNPQDPADAVLLRGNQGFMVFSLVGCVVLLAIMAGGAVWCLSRLYGG